MPKEVKRAAIKLWKTKVSLASNRKQLNMLEREDPAQDSDP